MAQFDVYENNDPNQTDSIPYFLDIQANLLGNLATRVVVPLYVPDAVDGRVIDRLALKVQVRGTSYVALTPELAGVSLTRIGSRVTNLGGSRAEIVGAIDLLISGI